MEPTVRNIPRLIGSSQFREINENQPNQCADYQLLNPEELRKKRSILLRGINNPTIEWDFKRTRYFFKENPISDPELKNAYQEYVKAYHQATSLYHFRIVNERSDLVIFDTENEKEDQKILGIPVILDWGTAIAKLPNNELFCYGKFFQRSGITLIIDSDYNVRILPSGIPNSLSSAVYFNRSVYCFGGHENSDLLTFSSKFDLDQNRWIKLAEMPNVRNNFYMPDLVLHVNESSCNSVAFDRKILISAYRNEHLLLYSIDTDSFSTIPYDFEPFNIKILINVEERFFAIEPGRDPKIYESEVGSCYMWTRIGSPNPQNWDIIGLVEVSTITNFMLPKVYWSYNKGAVYIGCDYPSSHIEYWTFDLKEKVLKKIY